MVEAVDNIVCLQDLEASVMEIVLDFVYGRVVSIPPEHAIAVFKASDRLQLPDLTKLVVGILKDEIQSDTIADVLQIAGNFMNEELWMACVQYTKANMHNLRRAQPGLLCSISVVSCVDIIGSQHYLQFMKSNAELAQRFQLDILEHSLPSNP